MPWHYLVIIQHGRAGVYEALKEQCGARDDQLSEVRVLWDRWQRERRVQHSPGGIERRHHDRRRPPVPTWSALRFVLMKSDQG
jgi:hypothetical protein